MGYGGHTRILPESEQFERSVVQNIISKIKKKKNQNAFFARMEHYNERKSPNLAVLCMQH